MERPQGKNGARRPSSEPPGFEEHTDRIDVSKLWDEDDSTDRMSAEEVADMTRQTIEGIEATLKEQSEGNPDLRARIIQVLEADAGDINKIDGLNMRFDGLTRDQRQDLARRLKDLKRFATTHI